MNTPHPDLEFVRPDQVAECWNGVSDCPGLNGRLWACVALYDEVEIENCAPSDVLGLNCVAKFWSRFTDEQRRHLNHLAVEQDEIFQQFMEGRR